MAWLEGTEEFVFIISVRRSWSRSCSDTLAKTSLLPGKRPVLCSDHDPRDFKNQNGRVL